MPITLPISPTNLFGNATVTIPLSNLDNNFSQIFNAVDGIGNGSVQIATGNIANLTTTGFLIGNATSNVLVADVNLSNTAAFFDGPSAIVGATGTYFASGTITVNQTGDNDSLNVKLWDGTTVIDSTQIVINASAGEGGVKPISLSGFITNPAAGIRLSAKAGSSTNWHIKANVSGQGRDSTVTAVRIS